MTTEHPFPGLRLGAVHGPADPRTLRFAAYTTPALPPPPRRVDWLGRVRLWPMYANDRIGDCEVCACAHAEQSLSVNGAGAEIVVTDRDVLGAYSAITGYNPATGQPDPGIRTLDMLNYWRRVGVGGRRITAYVAVDTTDRNEVRQAVNVAGALIAGADLPLAAGDQIRAGRPWTVTNGARGRAGSWGGHAIHVGAYDARGLVCTTWGRTQRMSWGWWDRHVVEAFAPISVDWLNGAGVTPGGLNLDQLTADLHAITAG